MEFIEFIEKMKPRELADYLSDAFERYSVPEDILMPELNHAKKINMLAGQACIAHNANRTVSHELWASGLMLGQFRQAAGLEPRFLPQTICLSNKTEFSDSLRIVRDLYTRQYPDLLLKRA